MKKSDVKAKETKQYSKRYAATVISITSIVICILTVVGIIVFNDHLTAENMLLMRDYVSEHWILGTLIFIATCVVQVVIALIPGEAVEIAAGIIFGPWLGLLLCIVGITLGSVLAIMIVRRFGRRFVEVFYPTEKIDSLPILREPKKRNATIFLLFFIPGTPKDLITYVVGLTEVSIPAYIALTSVARIPSILMSTLGGDAFGEGKIIKGIVIFGVAAIISGLGYLVYLWIQKMHEKKKNGNIS